MKKYYCIAPLPILMMVNDSILSLGIFLALIIIVVLLVTTIIRFINRKKICDKLTKVYSLIFAVSVIHLLAYWQWGQDAIKYPISLAFLFLALFLAYLAVRRLYKIERGIADIIICVLLLVGFLFSIVVYWSKTKETKTVNTTSDIPFEINGNELNFSLSTPLSSCGHQAKW